MTFCRPVLDIFRPWHPVCSGHRYPMVCGSDGRWRCRLKERARAIAYNQTEKGKRRISRHEATEGRRARKQANAQRMVQVSIGFGDKIYLGMAPTAEYAQQLREMGKEHHARQHTS